MNHADLYAANEQAIKFYQQHGYRPDETSPSQCTDHPDEYDYEILFKLLSDKK
jgi:hypothetical protein